MPNQINIYINCFNILKLIN